MLTVASLATIFCFNSTNGMAPALEPVLKAESIFAKARKSENPWSEFKYLDEEYGQKEDLVAKDEKVKMKEMPVAMALPFDEIRNACYWVVEEYTAQELKQPSAPTSSWKPSFRSPSLETSNWSSLEEKVSI
jgi:hypothetical protein